MIDTGKDALDVSATVSAKVGETGVKVLWKSITELIKGILKLMQLALKAGLNRIRNAPGVTNVKNLMRDGDETTSIKIPSKNLGVLEEQAVNLNFKYSLTKSGDEWTMTYKTKDAKIVELALQNIRDAALENKGGGEKVKLAELEKDGSKASHIEIDKADLTTFRKKAEKEGLKYSEQKVQGAKRVLVYYKDAERLQDVLAEMSKPAVGKATQEAYEAIKKESDTSINAQKSEKIESSLEDAKPRYEPIKVERDPEGNFVYSRGDISMVSQGEKGDVVRQRLQDTFGIGEKAAWAVWNKEFELNPIHVERANDGTFLYIRGEKIVQSKNEKLDVVGQKLKDTFGLDDKGVYKLLNRGLDKSRNQEVAEMDWAERKIKRPSIKYCIKNAEDKQQADRQAAKQAPQTMTQSTQKNTPAAAMAR